MRVHGFGALFGTVSPYGEPGKLDCAGGMVIPDTMLRYYVEIVQYIIIYWVVHITHIKNTQEKASIHKLPS